MYVLSTNIYISDDQLIQAGAIQLANNILNHDASVTKCNDAGMDCIATAEQTFTNMHQRLSSDDVAQSGMSSYARIEKKGNDRKGTYGGT